MVNQMSLHRLFPFLLSLLRPVVEHGKVLYEQFDPVRDVPAEITTDDSPEQLATFRAKQVAVDKGKHAFFLFPFAVLVLYTLDTLYILALHNFDYTNQRIPELVNHQMYPEPFWAQSDLIILAIVLCSLLVYTNLWRNNWLDDRFYMYALKDRLGRPKLIINGKVWDQANADRILSFRQANRRLRKVCMLVSYPFFQAYFQFHLWAKPERNLRHTFLSAYLSIFLIYTVFALIVLFYHFLIASKYILLKQKYLLARLNGLFVLLRNSVKAKETPSFLRLYRDWHRLNEDLAYQGREIRGYNAFWSLYLTAQFACHLFCLGRLAYCYLFIPASFDQTIYYLVFGSELALLIFALIYRCSHIDSNNDLAYQRNVKVAVGFQLRYKLSPKLLANIDTIATNRLFSLYCFRLKNNYRLDSTAFNLAFFILTTFFLSITKKAQHEQWSRI